MSDDPLALSIPDVPFRRVSGPPDESTPYLAPDLPPYFVPRTELYAIKNLLLSRPVASLAPLTLHGPSGAGKTALAAAIAHDADVLEAFPGGVLWASLGENADVQHAQALWADALSEDIGHLPDTASRAAALRTRLRDSRTLLIIDDVTDLEQVRALNVGGPNCARLITTDRGEEVAFALKTRRYVIGRMSEDEALALLTEWAGMLPDIYLPTVREIVQRLAYHALALALVGGQARQGITWLRLLEVLRDDQGPLAALDLDAAETRRKALRVVVNLVLSRFGGAQLQRSTLLAAFVPGLGAPFSAQAAAACWAAPLEEAEGVLETLVEAALVHRVSGDRFALHPALRDHLEQAARPGAVEEAARRVHAYYLWLAEQAAENQEAADAQLVQIVAAFQATAADPRASTLFADALMRYFESRGLWAALVALAAQVVRLAHEEGDLFREHAYLGDLGYAYTVCGDLAKARQVFNRSLELSREMGDPSGEATALNNLGAIDEREGQYDQALARYEQSLALRQHLGVREDIAEALNNVAGVLYWLERWDEALNAFQRALDMFDLLGDRHGQAQTWLNMGAVYERLGRDEEAEQSYQRSLAIYTNLSDEAGQAQALNNLGIIYLNAGETERALSHFKRSLALKEKHGDRPGVALTLNNMALLYEKEESILLALDHYERAYQILDVLEDPRAGVVRRNIDALRARIDEA